MSKTIHTVFGKVPIEKEYQWSWVEEYFTPLKALYECPYTTEIFVDRFDSISIEKGGRIQKTDIQFESNQSFQDFIIQLSTALNQPLNSKSPILDARLPDCSRICATLPDVTPQGATMTLRIAPKTHISATELVGFGALSQAMLDYLIQAIIDGKNIMVCERGVSFGYNNLVVDMLGFSIMKEFGYPVIFDATHALQMPGGRSDSADGRRALVAQLSRAGLSQGIAGLFLEAHPNPNLAKCDGPCALPLSKLEPYLAQMKAVDELVKSFPALDTSAE